MGVIIVSILFHFCRLCEHSVPLLSIDNIPPLYEAYGIYDVRVMKYGE